MAVVHRTSCHTTNKGRLNGRTNPANSQVLDSGMVGIAEESILGCTVFPSCNHMAATIVCTLKGHSRATTDTHPVTVGHRNVSSLHKARVGTQCRNIKVFVFEDATRVDTVTEGSKVVIVMDGEGIGGRSEQRSLDQVQRIGTGDAAIVVGSSNQFRITLTIEGEGMVAQRSVTHNLHIFPTHCTTTTQRNFSHCFKV